MKSLLCLLLTISCIPAWSQTPGPGARKISQFSVQGVSRLHALAKLGAREKVSLLIEEGDPAFLLQNIAISASDESLSKVIDRVLNGSEGYIVSQEGKLLLIRPSSPAKPLNRVLTLPVRDFTFRGSDSLSAPCLDPLSQGLLAVTLRATSIQGRC